MEIEGRAFRKLFPTRHIPIILISAIQAGSTLRKKKTTDREDWITRRLYGRLVQMPVFRDGPLDIALKPEIVSPEIDADTPRGELDIRISCGYGAEVYFAIEAKRLRVSYPNGKLDSGSSDYVEDGMMRFVTGKYAPFMESGAMLGYVFDGKINRARVNIDRIIRRRKNELKIKDPKRLARSSVCPGSPIDETCHALSRHSFTIYHIFLAV